MYAKVCDICNKIITGNNGKIINGDKVLIHICAETENSEQDFDLCHECFYTRFHGDFIGIAVEHQILKEKGEKNND